MASCPRGSNISALRTQSCFSRNNMRFSAIGTLGSSGPPPATTRTGLAQAWESMQKKTLRAMCHPSFLGLCRNGLLDQARFASVCTTGRQAVGLKDLRDAALGV
ncbi:hypothetical protein D3C81_2092820 [compost metagenome]